VLFIFLQYCMKYEHIYSVLNYSYQQKAIIRHTYALSAQDLISSLPFTLQTKLPNSCSGLDHNKL